MALTPAVYRFWYENGDVHTAWLKYFGLKGREKTQRHPIHEPVNLFCHHWTSEIREDVHASGHMYWAFDRLQPKHTGQSRSN
jgi:hypothetical protein